MHEPDDATTLSRRARWLAAIRAYVTNKAMWRSLALNLLLFAVLFAGIRLWQHRDLPSGAAPKLAGATLGGATYALPAKPDKPVLVHFWATWCGVCRAEQGSIDDIMRDHPNAITVAMQSGGEAEVARHLAAQGLHFPVVNDPDGRLASSWGVHAVPATFVIDTSGEVRFVEVGYTTGLGLRLRLWLAEHLG
jgi:thiol-disulfide isomerase/thioredoxin